MSGFDNRSIIKQNEINKFYFSTLALLKASTNNSVYNLCYCLEQDTWYRFLVAGSIYVANNQEVLTTGDGGDTRFIGVAGKYAITTIELQGKSINLEKYRQQNTKLVDDGNSTWVDERWEDDTGGVYSADTVNYRVGTKGAKCTGSAAGDGIHLVKAMNLDLFTDGNSVSGTSDYFRLYIFCEDVTKLPAGNAYEIILANDAYGTVTKYKYYDVPKVSLVTGKNVLDIPKSSFGTGGGGSFASITGIGICFAQEPTSETYFTVELMEVIRDDAVTAEPNQFQQCDNSTWESDFTVESGIPYVGLEDGSTGDVVYKNFHASDQAILQSVKLWSDFISHVKFVVGAATVGDLQWHYDNNNYFEIGVSGGNLVWEMTQGGDLTTESKTFTIVVGDIIDITAVKKGSTISVEAKINNDSSIVMFKKETTITTGLRFRPHLYPLSEIREIDVTTTESAYFAVFAEVAKTIQSSAIIDGLQPRMATAINRRYYHMSISKLNPGAAGAVWTAPSADTMGGWQVDAASEVLYLQTDIHADWDGVSDMTVEVYFEKNTAGGSGGDTVDLKLQCFYKGIGDAACKTQAIAESVTVVADNARYTQYKTTFIVDWNAASNNVEVGDGFGFILNLETDTSECDDIIINRAGYYYNTTHICIESGDV
jgi:hypothetical protein